MSISLHITIFIRRYLSDEICIFVTNNINSFFFFFFVLNSTEEGEKERKKERKFHQFMDESVHKFKLHLVPYLQIDLYLQINRCGEQKGSARNLPERCGPRWEMRE